MDAPAQASRNSKLSRNDPIPGNGVLGGTRLMALLTCAARFADVAAWVDVLMREAGRISLVLRH
jgi:hypothetical protein